MHSNWLHSAVRACKQQQSGTQFPHSAVFSSQLPNSPHLDPHWSMPPTVSLSLRRLFSCLSSRCHGDAGTSSTAAGSAGGREDLISRLPNDVLSTIISLLPTKDAARTALLSSEWRGLFASTPLVLDDSDLLLGGNFTGVSSVTATVSHAINRHPGPFRSVNLTCYFADDEGDILTGWIRALATKGVHKLALANIPWAGLDVLPRALLQCRSLERLHLSAWRFPDTAGVLHHGVVFPRLREFVLCKSVIRQQDLETMLACSPALKSVVFFLSCGVPAQVHLRSRSLQCIVFWQSVADELAVVAAPLLQRVILWSSSCSCRSDDHRMRIKISRASVLQVVGYLNPSFHQLQIGDTVMKAGIKASPEAAVPSVKILALSVRFGVAEEARMVPCFLRCFPNTETLHLMSVQDHGPTTEHSNFEFWKEIDSIQCVKSSIKKVVLHEFRWENYEIEFLTSIMERGQVLEMIYIFQAQYGCVPEGEINGKLSLLASQNWGGALMILSSQNNISRYDIATDLSRNDPFDCQS